MKINRNVRIVLASSSGREDDKQVVAFIALMVRCCGCGCEGRCLLWLDIDRHTTIFCFNQIRSARRHNHRREEWRRLFPS